MNLGSNLKFTGCLWKVLENLANLLRPQVPSLKSRSNIALLRCRKHLWRHMFSLPHIVSEN